MPEYTSPLSDFILHEILHGRLGAVDEDQDLLSTGIIDSLGILRLIAFLETRFRVEVPDEDVVFENFHSIRAMAVYLAAREHAAPAMGR